MRDVSQNNIFKYILKYLYFWMISLWLGRCLKPIRGRLSMWTRSLSLLRGCFVPEQFIEAFWIVGCSKLRRHHVQNYPPFHILSMIIRCVQRMKQAHVHVLILTELSLYAKCSPACLAFINIKDFFFSFFFLFFSWNTQICSVVFQFVSFLCE